MILSPSNISYFFTDVQVRFWNAYGAAPAWMSRIATEIPSSTEQNGYGWLGMMEKLRAWKGTRTVHTPAPSTYFVENKPFELTYGIDEFRLKDDTYGIYYPLVANMGLQARKWPDYQLRDLICNVSTSEWWYSATSVGPQLSLDGVAHWSGSHLIDPNDSGKGTYVNDYSTGTSSHGVTCGGVLTPNAYATVWTDMMARVSENSESLGLVGDLLMVPGQLDLTAKTILHAQFFAPQTATGLIGTGTNVGAMANVLVGSSDLLTNNDLNGASAVAWYLLCTSKPIKPFIWQLREAPDFVIRNVPSDPVVFDTHTYLYGTKARGAPGWSLPFLSSRSGV
jgi:phage major head subunit gpT-like protein